MINPNATGVFLHKPRGGIFREEGGIVEPFPGLAALPAPAGCDEDETVFEGNISRKALGKEIRSNGLARGDAAEVENAGGALPLFERNIVKGPALGKFVQGGIDVAAGVSREGEVLQVPGFGGAGVVGADDVNPHGRVGWAIGALVEDRLREVNEAHLQLFSGRPLGHV